MTAVEAVVEEPRVAYHGTPNIEAVLREGLRPDSWMALDRADAACFGDVVQIDLASIDGTWPREEDGTPSWQAHTNDQTIPASALELSR